MRSVLFVPGDSETKLVRAAESDADVVAVDLEDSVAIGSKPAARDMAKSFVADCKSSGKGPRIYVRVNSLQTAFAEADITAVMESAPDGILLPKARSGDDVRALCNLLGKLEKQFGITLGKTEISVLATEVPIALLCMHSFIGSSPRLTGLSWGSEDLSADLGAKATRDANGNLASPFRLARDLCLVTAAAAAVGAIDTIFIDLRDLPGLAREAAESACDGFTGKLALHPDQVAVINEAFTPTMAEISGAIEVVQAFAKGDSTGVLTLGGEVLDRPHLRRAEGVISRARLAGLLND